jgi:magnesium-transporting ATPase (P-type)
MAFAFQFDFPPFMVLIIALLNDGTIMTLSLDRVLPSATPDSWDLGEIFTFAFAYGLFLAAGTIAFFCTIVFTTFFERKFGVDALKDHNDPRLHMVIYLRAFSGPFLRFLASRTVLTFICVYRGRPDLAGLDLHHAFALVLLHG